MKIKTINDTTFSVNNLGDLKPEIIIGGKEETRLLPNLNMSFHNDEFWINLNRKDKIIEYPESFIIYIRVLNRGRITLLYSPGTDIWHMDKRGRLKWDIKFGSSPESNTICWELQHSDGIEFLYQDTLENEWNSQTEEFKKSVLLVTYLGNASRPEEIVGSYAVYCNKTRNNYKPGKLFHITRPLVKDAAKNKIWASYEECKVPGHSCPFFRIYDT